MYFFIANEIYSTNICLMNFFIILKYRSRIIIRSMTSNYLIKSRKYFMTRKIIFDDIVIFLCVYLFKHV